MPHTATPASYPLTHSSLGLGEGVTNMSTGVGGNAHEASRLRRGKYRQGEMAGDAWAHCWAPQGVAGVWPVGESAPSEVDCGT